MKLCSSKKAGVHIITIVLFLFFCDAGDIFSLNAAEPKVIDAALDRQEQKFNQSQETIEDFQRQVAELKQKRDNPSREFFPQENSTEDNPFPSQTSGTSLTDTIMIRPSTEGGRNFSSLKKSLQPILLESLELKNMDIIDVLKLIADKSGLDIVAGKDITGKVSIYLKDVNIWDALRIILDSYNLAYAEEDGIIRIMTDRDFQMKYGYKFGERMASRTIQLFYSDASDTALTLDQLKSTVGKVIADKNSNSIIMRDTPNKVAELVKFVQDSDIERTTKVFDLSYAQAEDVAKKLTETLTKNIGKIAIDTRSNKIIVTDIPQRIPQIEKIVKAVDVKEKEVLIEAKIVQVILSDHYKMGVQWEAILSQFHKLDLINSFNILDTTEKRGKISVGTFPTNNYNVFIEALQTVGTTNLLSNPRITVINNKEAKILVGSTQPYITSTTITPASGPTTTSEAVNFIEVGVKLYVTPVVHNDGYITMQIKPEVSSVTGTVKTSNNNTIPVVETSQAETTVLIKDGVTIVIGGLMKDEKVKTVNKFPLLGDLPVLGFIFRNTDDSVKKTELVIFLTPHIITGD